MTNQDVDATNDATTTTTTTTNTNTNNTIRRRSR